MSIADNLATPRFRWLDRWLEPRWRALLTWVAIAAVTGALFDTSADGVFQWMDNLLGNHVFPSLPFLLPVAVRSNAVFPSMVFLLYWFQPVALRLSWGRAGIWLLASAVLGVTTLAARQVIGSMEVLFMLLFGFFAGLPGFAVIGQRSRPWMTLVGGALSAGFVFLFDPEAKLWRVFILPGANLIYGAVMLYGTDPLPRRPAERQLDDDQRFYPRSR